MARPFALLLALLISASACSTAPVAEGCTSSGFLSEGDKLPDCSFDLLDGSSSAALSDFRGQPLLLNFWASWCPSCVREIPALDAFASAHPEVKIVGMDVVGIKGETLQAGREYFDRLGAGYPSLVDSEGLLYSHFGSVSRPVMPLTVAVDAQGVIKARRFGEVDEAILLDLVEQAS